MIVSKTFQRNKEKERLWGKKKTIASQAWWNTPVTPAFSKQRQED
jgi:hypothetical protein